MQAPVFNDVKVGDQLPPLALPAINRTTLALYCGASGDHNPIHIDHRLRPQGAHAGRVRARHALRRLPGPPADRLGAADAGAQSLAMRFSGITHLGNAAHLHRRV